MAITIEKLTHYPVKGLTGQALDQVRLEVGQGFPGDRRFGFARPNSGFDPDDPQPLPKTRFYMLARDAQLALLRTAYDEDTGLLTMQGAADAEQFDISTDDGKLAASAFLKSYLGLADDETPQLFEASPHRFTDVSVVSTEMMNAVSIINLDSVVAFSKTIGKDIDAGRFRGNIQISGLEAFSELEMIDRELNVGDVRFKLVKRTKRCPATEVNLATGERDIKLPRVLLQHYDHMDMGVYAEVLQGGVIKPGDLITIS